MDQKNEMHRRLILASASPRRKELLEAAGISCEVRPANIDERRLPGEAPLAYVRRLAVDKAHAVTRAGDEIILAADTTVEAGGEALEKPLDEQDAIRMLGLLRGRSHLVHTGFCIRGQDREIVDSETTEVYFSSLTDEEIARYVTTGQPMDKAGAYGIQGAASRFVERIEGCYFNVVGLPIPRVWRRLKEL